MKMTSTAITTIIKMMESVPESIQDQLVEHLRDYIEDMKDEMQWDASFKKTESNLISAAKNARGEINNGLATPIDYNRL
jgi:hypothetical protein